MCGIAGFLGENSAPSIVVKAMASSLKHRGPDDSGEWSDKAESIALSHRRLSIVDLSPEGHQPMLSENGRYVIVFNGEIYNHSSLRAELETINWRGYSDTEVILGAISEWGLEVALTKFIGMFAIALWDNKDKRLHLIRDRMGEKPLYYGWVNNAFVFGSELKALKKFPSFNNKINRDALALYLHYAYIPTPFSIYQQVYKLQPGCRLSLSLENARFPPNNYLAHAPFISEGFRLRQWWSLKDVAIFGQKNLIDDETEVLSQLEIKLRNSIRIQSQADVPLGAFLSGGVDSSLIASLMQEESNTPINTFTIGFNESRFNEAEYALDIANHLGTKHNEFYVGVNDCLDVISKIPDLYDEPFADSSQIPTFMVCSQASQNLTVALSGDAGDELFCGYNRYNWVPHLWQKIKWMPASTRALFAKAIYLLPPHYWESIYRYLEFLLPTKYHLSLVGEKLYKMAELLLSTNNIQSIFHNLVSEWKQPTNIVLNSSNQNILLTDQHTAPAFLHFEETMMYLDSISYLPDDILVKVDRAAMGTSLETRVPFLDLHVVELAHQIPLDLKSKNGIGKWPLKQLLYQYVPENFIERPKQGFSIPLAKWLRGDLRDWAESLLNETRIEQQGFFNPVPIRKKWEEHLSGQRNWEQSLWIILMFQHWLENNT